MRPSFSQVATTQADTGETHETSVHSGASKALPTVRVETGDTSLMRDLGATKAYLGDIAGAAQPREVPEGSADLLHMSISQHRAQLDQWVSPLAPALKISAQACERLSSSRNRNPSAE